MGCQWVGLDCCWVDLDTRPEHDHDSVSKGQKSLPELFILGLSQIARLTLLIIVQVFSGQII